MEIKYLPFLRKPADRETTPQLGGDFEGKHYVVPDLEYYECPACCELVFGGEAVRTIDA